MKSGLPIIQILTLVLLIVISESVIAPGAASKIVEEGSSSSSSGTGTGTAGSLSLFSKMGFDYYLQSANDRRALTDTERFAPEGPDPQHNSAPPAFSLGV